MMSRGLSQWLDLLRITATLIVVLSHWAYARFTGGEFLIIRELNLGSDAVIVFFVLSGFVIAYAAERDGALGRYSFNRLTRLWSVLLPALLLTFVFDRLGYGMNPSAYPSQYHNPLPLGEMLLRGLSFSNEWAQMRVRLGTNGPLWSLSYEAAFYALFGAAMFLRGPRRIAVLLLMIVLFGSRVLLLMPAWLMGVALWHWVKRGTAMPTPRAWLMCVGGPVLYVLSLMNGLPWVLQAVTAEMFAPVPYRAMLFFSDEFIWNALIGVFTAMHLIGAATLMKESVRQSWVPWLAGASFSVYVTHYPALHLLDAMVPEGAFLRDWVLLAGSLVVGFAFAELFERRLGAVRSASRTVLRLLRVPTSDHRAA